MKRDSVYVDVRTLRVISWLLVAVGAVAIVVPTVLLGQALLTHPKSAELPVALVENTTADQASAYLEKVNPQQARFIVDDEGMRLSVPEPTRWEILTNRADTILLGLTIALAAFLLRPITTSIAEDRPFGAHNARRLGMMAVVSAVAVILVPLTPGLAAMSALDRLGLTGSESPFLFGINVVITPAFLFPWSSS